MAVAASRHRLAGESSGGGRYRRSPPSRQPPRLLLRVAGRFGNVDATADDGLDQALDAEDPGGRRARRHMAWSGGGSGAGHP
jgi:hypothetical protein